jgi:hypothetical protein
MERDEVFPLGLAISNANKRCSTSPLESYGRCTASPPDESLLPGIESTEHLPFHGESLFLRPVFACNGH